MTGLITLLLLAWLAWFLYRRFKRRRAQPNWEDLSVAQSKRWLADLGPSHTARVAAIEELFVEQSETLASTYRAGWTWRPGTTDQKGKPVEYNAQVIFTVSRNLASLDNRERTYLKFAEMFNSAADGTSRQFRHWRTALLLGNNKGNVTDIGYTHLEQSQTTSGAALAEAIKHEDLTPDHTINYMHEFAAATLDDPAVPAAFRTIAGEMSALLSPGGNSAWLAAVDIPSSPFKQHEPYFPVHIGSLEDGTPLTYSGEGSIVTIASPGSGKTTANVYPNLLTWQGPAIVLDISGEIYGKTATWRRENVGPVYKFSPLEPDDSHQYNPLSFVRGEPDYIWEDSRLLAEMMIVPSLSSDPFWENEARTALTAAIAYVCHENGRDERPMRAVLDILFGGPAWNAMIVGLRSAIDVHVMTQHATALSAMSDKTLNSVLQTARSSLTAWAGERVARATSRSEWDPEDLRSGTNPTVYIYIKPNEVDSYLSLLRVFIGQHIRVLTGGDVPDRGSPPILVMLDELPRLRYMAPIDEGLSIGRKYGLRLWMFAQSLGQFQTSYPNADGMLGSCAVRIFMSPGGADGLAERVSEELGYVDSLTDNSRRRLVEATDLSGPAYEKLQIVLSNGGKPAKVRKDFFYDDPELKVRAGGDGAWSSAPSDGLVTSSD